MSQLERMMKDLFGSYATKTVTHTDKAKAAYVLSKEQVKVLRRAGLRLTSTKPAPTVDIQLIEDPPRSVVASYYHSARSAIAGRPPEPRMGREFITDWLEEGDIVVLATDGHRIFAAKDTPEANVSEQLQRLSDRAAAGLSIKYLEDAASRLPSKPKKRTSEREEFVRSPLIAELVRRRSRDQCEFPGCTAELFQRDDKSNYLEVHHIVWLRNGGEDTVKNAAALCPRCHRAMHSAHDRKAREKALKEAIARKTN